MKAILIVMAVFSLFSFNAKAQWQSNTVGGCAAYTDCYARNAWGQLFVTHRISCQVYSATYAFGPNYSSQACQWYAIPGVSVHCSGYAQVQSPAGVMWGWQNYNYSCN